MARVVLVGGWLCSARACDVVAEHAAGPDPGDQLVGLFDALTTACRRPGYRGCAVLNAAAETPPGSPVHDRTVAHKQSVLAWVRDLAQRAGAQDPDQLARALTLLLDGAAYPSGSVCR